MEIAVAGTGTASLRPERATIHLTAGFEGPEPQEPLRRTTALVNRISEDIDRLRVAVPSPTTWSAVLPLRTRTWRPFSTKGTVMPLVHGASASVQVKFRDFTALAAFVDRWGGVEGVTLAGVRWALTEATRTEQERRVLIRAVAHARDRAEAIATAAEAGTVRLLEVADPGLLGGNRTAPVPPSAVAARLAAGATPSGAGPIDLAPEDIELSAVVHARFVTAG